LAEKRRPALVVSDPELGSQLGRLWVAMITTDRDKRLVGDASIRDLVSAGLPAASILRASKIATIEIDRVLRKGGSLAPADQEAAAAALRLCSAF
jgi:mRNA interferase MazF